jgi:enolase
MFENGKYNLPKESKKLNSSEMVKFWVSWAKQYPIV